MSVTGKNNENVNVRRRKSFLINVVKHYKIREILLIMRTRVLRFDYKIAHLAYTRYLRAHTGIRKIRKEQHFPDIILLRQHIAPFSHPRAQRISFVHRYVPVLKVNENVSLRF